MMYTFQSIAWVYQTFNGRECEILAGSRRSTPDGRTTFRVRFEDGTILTVYWSELTPA